MLWLLLCLSLFFSEEATLAPLDKPFPLKIGEKVVVEPGELEITFLRLEEDSRCPEGVNCIWAGQATILLQIKRSGGETVQTMLTGFNLKEKMETTVDGYHIRFQALLPRPKTTEPPNPAVYLATLVVTAP